MKPDDPFDPSNPSMANPVGPSADRAADRSAEEGELVRRAAAGDPGAFRILVDRHRDRTYGLALRIIGTRRDAEEVAQDAFVRAWCALPQFRLEAAFTTWLYRITTRLAFDRVAVLRARAGRETSIEWAAEIPARGETSSDPDRGREIESSIAALPEKQRAVVTLFYYQDRSVKDVARILDLNENTVKTHLRRARATLRSALLRRRGGVP